MDIGGFRSEGSAGLCGPAPAYARSGRALLGLIGLVGIAGMGCAIALLAAGCDGLFGGNSNNTNRLDAMDQETIRIDQQQFRVWLALDDTQRQLGLMQVKAEELASIPNPDDPSGPPLHRGMLFAFPNEIPLAFWMYNTITALDIAYIDSAGRIVKTYTMAPLETRTYPSIAPAQYALEVRAGLFEEFGIGPGMLVEIPDSVLKAVR
jgi:uncharacterized membrane protein (UPF0127 family)